MQTPISQVFGPFFFVEKKSFQNAVQNMKVFQEVHFGYSGGSGHMLQGRYVVAYTGAAGGGIRVRK